MIHSSIKIKRSLINPSNFRIQQNNNWKTIQTNKINEIIAKILVLFQMSRRAATIRLIKISWCHKFVIEFHAITDHGCVNNFLQVVITNILISVHKQEQIRVCLNNNNSKVFRFCIWPRYGAISLSMLDQMSFISVCLSVSPGFHYPALSQDPLS